MTSTIIDRPDISEIKSDYKDGGASSYNSMMLLKVIVYAYPNNVYSGRHMENLLVNNIARFENNVMEALKTAEDISDRYGLQSDEACADSGYSSEQNCTHLFGKRIVPYVTSTSDRRTIEVNHQSNSYKAKLAFLQASEGLSQKQITIWSVPF